jgi:hypothetical protein
MLFGLIFCQNGDSKAIDHALSLMTASTSLLAPRTPPPYKGPSDVVPATPSYSSASRRSAKGKHKASEAEIEVTRLCGELALVNVTLDEYQRAYCEFDAKIRLIDNRSRTQRSEWSCGRIGLERL